MANSEVLVEIRDLYTNFYTYQGVVKALDGINLEIKKGETFGLVGETGCGKSVTANSILRLVPSPPGKIERGSILFAMPEEKRQQMEELEKRLKELRGKLNDKQVKAIQEYFHNYNKSKFRNVRKKSLELLDAAAKEYVKTYVELEKLRRPYDLLKIPEAQLRHIRGKYISMIFQEPMSSLNPVFTAGDQIAENILLHEKKEMAQAAVSTIDRQLKLLSTPRASKVKTEDGRYQCSKCKTEIDENTEICPKCSSGFYRNSLPGLKKILLKYYRNNCLRMSRNPDDVWLRLKSRIPLVNRYEKIIRNEALLKAREMLKLVRIPDPDNVLKSYPHELSGGMQQRVTIAMALACKPQMLIADEPTTALDVTIQAQILKLMTDLQKEMGTSILLITHNLGVVAETCHRVGVMYAGTMAEIADVYEIFKEPLHPYTQGLMNSIPKLSEEVRRLEIIEGNVPNLIHPPPGCRFHPRCPYAVKLCREKKPELTEVRPGHFVACHLYSEGG